MAPLGSAHASGEDAGQVVDRCLKTLAARPPGDDLGFLYVTDSLAAALPDMVDRLRAGTGIENWSAAVGIGICASGVEYWGQPAASVLCGAFGADAFRVFGANAGMLGGIVGTLDEWRDRTHPLFAVVHADPRTEALTESIAALSAWMPDGFLAGGLASARDDAARLLAPAAPGGIAGVMFAGDVAVSTRHTQGCTPIGPRHRITAAEGNVLAELDGRVALDVFREDIGEVLARDMSRVGGYIFAGVPVARADTGDYLVRNLLGIDPQRGLLAIAEQVDTGGEVLFCRRDGDSARTDLLRMLGELKTSLGGRAPAGGLYVSCLARGPAMFGAASAEMQIISEELGDFPLAGFFANGEISHDRLYSYTGVLSLFP